MLGRGPFLLMQVVTAYTVTVSEDDHIPLLMNFAYPFIEKAPEAQASERG